MGNASPGMAALCEDCRCLEPSLRHSLLGKHDADAASSLWHPMEGLKGFGARLTVGPTSDFVAQLSK
jgi:hypothetical protein